MARALSVTKGSFYWHFRDRSDLLDAVIDLWEDETTWLITEGRADLMTQSQFPELSKLEVSELRGLLADYWNDREHYDRIIAEIDRRKSVPPAADSVASGGMTSKTIASPRDPRPIVDSGTTRHVIVKDIEMSFGSMVIFMIKWSLAAIPAFLILVVISAIVVGIFRAVM